MTASSLAQGLDEAKGYFGDRLARRGTPQEPIAAPELRTKGLPDKGAFSCLGFVPLDSVEGVSLAEGDLRPRRSESILLLPSLEDDGALVEVVDVHRKPIDWQSLDHGRHPVPHADETGGIDASTRRRGLGDHAPVGLLDEVHGVDPPHWAGADADPDWRPRGRQTCCFPRDGPLEDEVTAPGLRDEVEVEAALLVLPRHDHELVLAEADTGPQAGVAHLAGLSTKGSLKGVGRHKVHDEAEDALRDHCLP